MNLKEDYYKKTSMKKLLKISVCGLSIFLASTTLLARKIDNVQIYTTTANKQKLMYNDSVVLNTKCKTKAGDNVIELNPSVTFQDIDGFGAAITGSTCYNLLKMSKEDRHKLLKETFDPVDGYGYSYIRIALGTSDFALEDYSYCDKPGLENFAIHELDKRDLFPILKEIQEINPDVKIMATPWTPPKWMKVNNLKDLQPHDYWTDGQLNPKYYQEYADYFVKYIEAMNKEGFDIASVTIQNEPLNRGNSASMYMTWQEQRDFIKEALGPAFEKAGISTKIIVYDHNYNYDNEKPENADQYHYPLNIYKDEDAAKYIDGAAYHAYGGDKSEMLYVHNERPDKNLYFTEISIGEWGDGYSFGGDLMWNIREVCIGTLNNFSKAVIVWNLMLDDKHEPYRPGGCTNCLGAIDINSSDYETMVKNSHYYEMAQLAKVIKPGAKRLESKGNTIDGLYYTSFLNKDKSYAAVVQNDTDKTQNITIKMNNKCFSYKLEPYSVSSFLWK